MDGEVTYGDMDAKAAEDYPGQIVFNGSLISSSLTPTLLMLSY